MYKLPIKDTFHAAWKKTFPLFLHIGTGSEETLFQYRENAKKKNHEM
jgi:hypothetical protein